MVGDDKTDVNGGSWGWDRYRGLLAKPLGLSKLDEPREAVLGFESFWAGRCCASIDC